MIGQLRHGQNVADVLESACQAIRIGKVGARLLMPCTDSPNAELDPRTSGTNRQHCEIRQRAVVLMESSVTRRAALLESATTPLNKADHAATGLRIIRILPRHSPKAAARGIVVERRGEKVEQQPVLHRRGIVGVKH